MVLKLHFASIIVESIHLSYVHVMLCSFPCLLLLYLVFSLHFFYRFRVDCRRSYSTPRAVITPVRRSTRRTICNLPSMLQDHDRIVESLNQLSVDDKKQALFMPNSAIANN